MVVIIACPRCCAMLSARCVKLFLSVADGHPGCDTSFVAGLCSAGGSGSRLLRRISGTPLLCQIIDSKNRYVRWRLNKTVDASMTPQEKIASAEVKDTTPSVRILQPSATLLRLYMRDA